MSATAAEGTVRASVAYPPISGLRALASYTLTARVFVPTGSPAVRAVADGITEGPLTSVFDAWTDYAFTFTTDDQGSPVTLGWVTDDATPPAYDSVAYIDDAALAYTNGPGYFDGDTVNDPAVGTFTWDGTPGQSSTTWYEPVQPLLAGPALPPQGRVIMQWQVSAIGQPVQVWVGAVSEDGGTVLDQQGPVTVTSAGRVVTWDVPQSPGVTWRPAIWVMGQGVNFALVTWIAEQLSPEECIAPYVRTFADTYTVDGPTVTGAEVTDCGDRFLYVEWTWVAANPYRFGAQVVMSAGATSSQGPTQQLTGVITTPRGQIDATPYNCAERTPFPSCAQDPCYAGFVAPPTPPVIPDPSRPNITTQPVRAVSVYVPANLVPSNEGVFTFVLANDASDKVGVRVRVYGDVPGTGVPSDLCAFAYEYLIDYIAPGAIFTIDGMTGTGRVLCEGDVTESDASSVMRGSFGGPTEDPVVACGRGYYAIVQWLATYPKTATCNGSTYYTAGQPQGELHLAASITPREG